MDTISSTAFGVQLDSVKDLNHPMIVNGKRVMGTHRESSFLNRMRSMIRIGLFCKYYNKFINAYH